MNCNECPYYDKEKDYCNAFVCDGTGCPPLPCEEEQDDI